MVVVVGGEAEENIVESLVRHTSGVELNIDEIRSAMGVAESFVKNFPIYFAGDFTLSVGNQSKDPLVSDYLATPAFILTASVGATLSAMEVQKGSAFDDLVAAYSKCEDDLTIASGTLAKYDVAASVVSLRAKFFDWAKQVADKFLDKTERLIAEQLGEMTTMLHESIVKTVEGKLTEGMDESAQKALFELVHRNEEARKVWTEQGKLD